MTLWRICSRRHGAFDGDGARLAGGRWTRRGTPVIYTSGSISLAALEMLVHTDTDLLPDDLVLVEAGIPEACSMISLVEPDLPPNWRDYPAPEALQEIGTAWAEERRALVLAVPSAVVPEERNYVINPLHAEFAPITVRVPRPFRFDARLAARR